MKADPIQKAVGARMKRAAVEAGLSAVQVAEKMNVTEQAVYLWWQGRRRISPEDRERYAALTGKDIFWFYRLTEERLDYAGFLQDLIGAMLEDGRRVDDVISEALGGRIEPEDRALLAQEDRRIRADLEAGRLPMEARLTPEEHRQLQSFLQDLLARRGPGDPKPG